ncbi:MAG: hypothetical protein IT332_04560 [Ardenticatenales bacterium]|nr:hypothetical protein [Ardenticatenales bacterium]
MVQNSVKGHQFDLRRSWLALPLVAAALLVFFQAQATSASAPGERILPEEQAVVDLVNAERKKAGQKPLIVNYSLQEAAWAHNEHMVARKCFSHTGCGDGAPGDRVRKTGYMAITVGENIAQGQPDAAAVMDSWMNSSGHRKNILSNRYTDIGVAYSPQPIDFSPVWTQVFAAPQPDYRTVTPPRAPQPTAKPQECKIAEDVNADRIVNRLDVEAVSDRFLETPGAATWDPRYDVVPNGMVDLFDVFGVVKAMGASCP